MKKVLIVILTLALFSSCSQKCRPGKEDSLRAHQKLQKDKEFKGYKMSSKELKGAGLK